MSAAYTVLRVTPSGQVPLFEAQVGRLGEASRDALGQFAAQAPPGVYRAHWDGASLRTAPRPPSRLVEGMPTRLLISPFAGVRGRYPKPPPPSPYEAVRLNAVATLLTDAAGEELYESCVAAVLAWDGNGLVLPPGDAPAVASLAEAAVAAQLPHRRARILVKDAWPLLLINAVAGSCAVVVAGRPSFPAAARAQVDAVLAMG